MVQDKEVHTLDVTQKTSLWWARLAVSPASFSKLFQFWAHYETENKDEKQIRKEYNYRSFKRSFTVDEKVDSEKIEAKYVNGVLTLNLPRKEEVKASAKEILVK